MLEVRSELVEEGYRLKIFRRETEGLLRKKTVFVPCASWEGGLKELSPFAAAVLDDLQAAGKLGPVDAQTKFLGFSAAAGLQNADAEVLGLLPAFPYQLDIQSHGSLGTSNFQIEYHASEGGVRILGTFSEGIFTEGTKRFRIGGLLFSILAEIGRLTAEITVEGKISSFAALRLLLPDHVKDPNIRPENYLLRIRIAHVTAIGLNPIIANGNVSFDPVPMRRRDPENYEAGAEIAIPPAANDQFAKEFRTQTKVNSTYVIESQATTFTLIPQCVRL